MSAGAAWERVVRAALLGTERQSAPADASTGDPALDGAVAALEGSAAEARLLGTAVLLDAWRRAGQRAGRIIANPPEPAPEGADRTCSPLAARVLRQILAGAPPPVLAEWMTLARQAGVVPPHEVLPELLHFGMRHADVHGTVAEGIGPRGRWLAAMNPAWGYATRVAPDPVEGWETGTAEERVRILHALRRSDPAAAPALVQSTWATDPARDRAAFVGALSVGLGMDDEPFLESLLDDKRSKEVRTAAARLLAALPGSRLVARMTARLVPLLTLRTPEGLVSRIRGEKARIDVELPAACDKAMQRDGIEIKPPYGMGERTWWLQQMLSSVPPSAWTAHWGMDAAAVLEAARAGEEGTLLIAAWMTATVRSRDSAWAEALLRAGNWSDVERVAELLAPEQLEPLALERLRPLDLERLRPGQTGLVSGNPAAVLLLAARFPWSPELTRAAVRAVPREDPWYGLAELARTLALYMHPETAVATLREQGDPHEGKWVDLIHLRHTLHQAFQ